MESPWGKNKTKSSICDKTSNTATRASVLTQLPFLSDEQLGKSLGTGPVSSRLTATWDAGTRELHRLIPHLHTVTPPSTQFNSVSCHVPAETNLPAFSVSALQNPSRNGKALTATLPSDSPLKRCSCSGPKTECDPSDFPLQRVRLPIPLYKVFPPYFATSRAITGAIPVAPTHTITKRREVGAYVLRKEKVSKIGLLPEGPPSLCGDVLVVEWDICLDNNKRHSKPFVLLGSLPPRGCVAASLPQGYEANRHSYA